MIRAIINSLARGEDLFTDPLKDLANLIRLLQSKDSVLPELRQRKSKVGVFQNKDNNLRFKGDALYVLSDSALRAKLIRIYYNDKFVGYFGRDKTETLLKRKYYQPKLVKDVAEYVVTYKVC